MAVQPLAVAADDPRLDRLAELIAASPHNLVSRGERANVRSVHIPEALAVAGALPLAGGQRWADLGTGAGLPGLVCAMAHLDVNWTLIDTTRKKVAFVGETGAELGLSNVEAVHGRLEELGAPAGGYEQAFDGVVARAVAPLPQLLKLARPFVPEGGWVVAVKGPRWRDEAARAAPLLSRLRLSSPEVEHLRDLPRATVLLRLRAEGPVPRARATVETRRGPAARRS